MLEERPIVLASGSEARRRLLERAGVAVEVSPVAVDEGAVRSSCRSQGCDGVETAIRLAKLKAGHGSSRHPGRWVLGGDQMLVCEGRWFEQPGSVEGVGRQLRELRGRGHRLISAAAVVRDQDCLWHGFGIADLRMRNLSDSFIDEYSAIFGEVVKNSVGGYQIEGLDAQLFQEIAGDLFTIQGLPLLQILEFLRDQGVLQK